MLYEVTKGLGIEQVHCTSGMLYEVTKGLGIEQVHCIPGMLYEVTKGPGDRIGPLYLRYVV